MKDVPCMSADCARAWMCADWLIRTYTPAWLRLAGRDTATLEGLPELGCGMRGYHHYFPTPPTAVIANAIMPQELPERRMLWRDFYACVSRAAALAGGPAVRDAFKAVPWLAPGAPDSQIDHIVQIAMGNVGAALEAVVHEAAGEAGWNDILEAEHRATRDTAVEAARRARREILQAAPTEVRRATRDAKRAAPRWERDMRKTDERMTRRNAEEAARRTVGPAVRPYVWIRAKARRLGCRPGLQDSYEPVLAALPSATPPGQRPNAPTTTSNTPPTGNQPWPRPKSLLNEPSPQPSPNSRTPHVTCSTA
ncbi:hypothetical protein ACFWJ5_39805 [Streptomyces qaidamensis]|uniref:hypothetical protein n=1 Tax=Streptomyces qaidamensis TaxID=1783515 RepID=UPI0036638E43